MTNESHRPHDDQRASEERKGREAAARVTTSAISPTGTRLSRNLTACALAVGALVGMEAGSTEAEGKLATAKDELHAYIAHLETAVSGSER